MNSDEIWSYALEKGYTKDCNISGKTPGHTLGAQIYVNIGNDENSPFYKYSARPQKFGLNALRNIYPQQGSTPAQTPVRQQPRLTFNERDLHPLLAAYVYSDEYFQASARTIYHEKSTKSGKNAEKWLHPDIVAVHYAFQDLRKEVVDLATKAGESAIKLFSFELKKEITPDTVREYYFQAVSNSSWANEGYLVAPKISEEALQQLVKLNASFGIGVIKLNLDDVYQSEVLIPSKDNETLDLGMMDELVKINPDFEKFVQNINKSLKTDEIVKAHYDKVLDEEELVKYMEEKGMTVKRE